MEPSSTSEQPRSREGGAPPAVAPHRVLLPVNIHHWGDIAFLHWSFDPQAVAALVPEPLRVLTRGGRAWVSVTPFFMQVRPPGLPVVPPRWAFPETNVRTYVTSPDGTEGLWFLRMEVTALWFVATLRALGLPYFRQRMSMDSTGDRITYTSRPRSSAGRGGHDIVVTPGETLLPDEERALDRFVTARWGAYHRRGPLLMYTPVEHQRWPLQAGEAATHIVDDLFRSAGLGVPSGPPLVHFSKGVTVKVGRPRIVA